jgi:hypothetical protein
MEKRELGHCALHEVGLRTPAKVQNIVAGCCVEGGSRKTPPDGDHPAGLVWEGGVPKLGCDTAGQ